MIRTLRVQLGLTLAVCVGGSTALLLLITFLITLSGKRVDLLNGSMGVILPAVIFGTLMDRIPNAAVVALPIPNVLTSPGVKVSAT